MGKGAKERRTAICPAEQTGDAGSGVLGAAVRARVGFTNSVCRKSSFDFTELCFDNLQQKAEGCVGHNGALENHPNRVERLPLQRARDMYLKSWMCLREHSHKELRCQHFIASRSTKLQGSLETGNMYRLHEVLNASLKRIIKIFEENNSS